jgi:ADP-ribose pyrophosphatase
MEELQETVIGSETIFEGRVVRLRVDKVRLPNGTESKREIVWHHGAVCIVPVRDDGMALMVRQFRLAAGKTLLEIPAGTLEPGESPAECATRELEEETGYRAENLRFLFSAYLAPGYSTECIHAFLATGLTQGEAHADADENLHLVPIPLAELENRILEGEIEDSKTISATLMALRWMERERTA